ncbi:hypothetical protein pb186bvf_000896 [Paramecium bursaria]
MQRNRYLWLGGEYINARYLQTYQQNNKLVFASSQAFREAGISDQAKLYIQGLINFFWSSITKKYFCMLLNI